MNLSHAAERMVMSQPLWWVLMGLEMVPHVVHGPTLEKLLQLEWAALHTGLNERIMRPDRPQKDALLHRTFDIDAEANLLDLIEADVHHTGSVRTVLGHLDHGADLMLELIVWASIGRWEVWEGRVPVSRGGARPNLRLRRGPLSGSGMGRVGCRSDEAHTQRIRR